MKTINIDKIREKLNAKAKEFFKASDDSHEFLPIVSEI